MVSSVNSYPLYEAPLHVVFFRALCSVLRAPHSARKNPTAPRGGDFFIKRGQYRENNYNYKNAAFLITTITLKSKELRQAQINN